MKESSKKEYSQTVDNAMRLIACFADAEELGITQLARELSMSKASVSRIVAALERRGFLTQNKSSGKYALGVSMMMYGSLAKERNVLAKAFEPALRALAEKYTVTAHISTFIGKDLVILNKISAGPFVYMSSRVGGTLPPYATAMGKCILAFSSEEFVTAYIGKETFERFTQNTLSGPEELYAELKNIRAKGYAVDDGEKHTGLYCIARPILNKGNRPIAAISVSGSREMVEPIRDDIADTMERLISATIY